LFCAFPAWGASSSLPGNSVIRIKPFSFSAALLGAAEGNLPAVFQDQLAYALQDAGFILSSVEPVERPPVPEALPFSAAGAKPLEKRRPASPAEKTTAPGNPAEAGGGSVAASRQAALPPPLPSRPEDEPDVVPVPEEAAAADDPGEDAEVAPPPPGPAAPAPPEYVLSGRVTRLREYAGPPARIAGGLRVRREAAISLAYSIADPSSGRTLFSDAVSASATLLVPENENPDASRSDLRGRVMAEAAARLAARLAGREAEAAAEDRDYYGDSPGKRLKPGKQGGESSK
jgi:hypothetical protein